MKVGDVIDVDGVKLEVQYAYESFDSGCCEGCYFFNPSGINGHCRNSAGLSCVIILPGGQSQDIKFVKTNQK